MSVEGVCTSLVHCNLLSQLRVLFYSQLVSYSARTQSKLQVMYFLGGNLPIAFYAIKIKIEIEIKIRQ